MAGKRRAPKYKKLSYCYINDDLHKVLAINKAADKVWAYSFAECKRKMYSWSTVQRTVKRAYTVDQMAKLIGLSHITIRRAMDRGDIPRPQRSWPLKHESKDQALMNHVVYRFSEDEVYDVHEYFANVHVGRPRKDGFATRKGFITKQELRRLINTGTMIYIEDDDGSMIPVWKERFV